MHPVLQKIASARQLDLDRSRLRNHLTLPGVSSAALVLQDAIKSNRRICIFGDYDVDGITGTTILVRTLRYLGADVFWHIPHRTLDGYGLSESAIRRIAAFGASILVTVDCGISSPLLVRLARSLGLEVIVTDHHEPGHNVQECVSAPDHLVHCGANPGNYGFSGLCGSATAWKLSQALYPSDPQTPGLPADNLALAALGTVADVVPLRDENRVIVHLGLSALQSTSLPGLVHLLRVCNLTDRTLDAGSLGFQLGPRINACGRLACASLAAEMLLTRSDARASFLADFCDRLNQERKVIERRIYDEVLGSVSDSDPAVVFCGRGWHSGVVGIVAARLVEKTGKPVILCQERNGYVFGSGRAPSGIALHSLLDTCDEYLLSYGGHAAAVGLRTSSSLFPLFRDRFMEAASAIPVSTGFRFLQYDAAISLSDLTQEFMDDLELLAPFGKDNPEPRFYVPDCEVQSPRIIGKDRSHLSFTLVQDGKSIRTVAFSMADRLSDLSRRERRFVISPQINDFRGTQSIEARLVDFE